MRYLILICAVIASLQLHGQSDLQSQLNSKRVTLPNGWKLSPHGTSISLGDLPLNVVVSPNQKYILVTNNGQSIQSLQLIDVASNQVLDSKELPKSWYGLKVAADNKTVFVSGGKFGGQRPGYPMKSSIYTNNTIGGSVLLDIDQKTFKLKWIQSDGQIGDGFVLEKR